MRDWVADLGAPGARRHEALRDLHDLLVRASRYRIEQMGEAHKLGATRLDELAHTSANEALVAILGKLATFEGRSRFTT